MPFSDQLGRTVALRIERLSTPGAFLTSAPLGTPDPPVVLLPGKELLPADKAGASVEVFVYRDSDGRFIATRARPKVERDEVAFLTVVSVDDIGAFVDWGLSKDLLVPYAEQTRDLEVGQRQPIGVYVDKTGRLAGTMRVGDLLQPPAGFHAGDWVDGESWRQEPGVGTFIIVARKFLALIPETEPHTLTRGAAVRARVSKVLPDGKIELSLRRYAHEELADDAAKILEVLSRPGAPRVGDRSPPEHIRMLFGLSKKAFKRATARLLSSGKLDLAKDGTVSVKR